MIDINQTATIDPLHFHSPVKISREKASGCCFACSHKLEKVYVKATCLEDGYTRDLHVICWESNVDGKTGTFKDIKDKIARDAEYSKREEAKRYNLR